MSNEQVFHAYDVSAAKADNMVAKLKRDLEPILGRKPSDEEATFQYVVLLDDFSGSGTTAIRQENDGKWDGKITKIVQALEANDQLGRAIAASGVRVLVVLYVASKQAADYLGKHIPNLPFSKGTIELAIVNELSAKTSLDDTADADILGIANQDRYFDSEVDDEHAAVGGKSKRLECVMHLS